VADTGVGGQQRLPPSEITAALVEKLPYLRGLHGSHAEPRGDGFAGDDRPPPSAVHTRSAASESEFIGDLIPRRGELLLGHLGVLQAGFVVPLLPVPRGIGKDGVDPVDVVNGTERFATVLGDSGIGRLLRLGEGRIAHRSLTL